MSARRRHKGHVDRDSLDAVIKIGTESPGADLLASGRSVRTPGGRRPGSSPSPDAHETSVLEEAQQLGLHRDRQLATSSRKSVPPSAAESFPWRDRSRR